MALCSRARYFCVLSTRFSFSSFHWDSGEELFKIRAFSCKLLRATQVKYYFRITAERFNIERKKHPVSMSREEMNYLRRLCYTDICLLILKVPVVTYEVFSRSLSIVLGKINQWESAVLSTFVGSGGRRKKDFSRTVVNIHLKWLSSIFRRTFSSHKIQIKTSWFSRWKEITRRNSHPSKMRSQKILLRIECLFISTLATK